MQRECLYPSDLLSKLSSLLDAHFKNPLLVKGKVLYDERRNIYKLSDGRSAITLNFSDALPVGVEVEVEGMFKPNLYIANDYSALYPSISVNSYRVLDAQDIENQWRQWELIVENAIRDKEHFGFWEIFTKLLEEKRKLRIGLIYGVSAQVGQDFKSAFNISAGKYYKRVEFVEFEAPLSDGELAETIIKASRSNLDALFLLRGGGSREELARVGGKQSLMAILHAGIPFYTAIGHSFDRMSSLVEKVADGSFATPSIAGAELGKLVRFFSEFEEIKLRETHLKENLAKLEEQMKKITAYQRRPSITFNLILLLLAILLILFLIAPAMKQAMRLLLSP